VVVVEDIELDVVEDVHRRSPSTVRAITGQFA
jgi:hypothetical protein